VALVPGDVTGLAHPPLTLQLQRDADVAAGEHRRHRRPPHERGDDPRLAGDFVGGNQAKPQDHRGLAGTAFAKCFERGR
jgi:hypothetical protein